MDIPDTLKLPKDTIDGHSVYWEIYQEDLLRSGQGRAAKVPEARGIGESESCPCFPFEDGKRISVVLKQQCTSKRLLVEKKEASAAELMENPVTYTSSLPSSPVLTESLGLPPLRDQVASVICSKTIC